MKRPIYFFFIFSVQCLLGQKIYQQSFVCMGVDFEMSVVSTNEEEANRFIDLGKREIDRIERLISSWDPSSQTSAVNKQAGRNAVAVDTELFLLIQRAVGISRLTDGAFDLTYAAIDPLWVFDGQEKSMPKKEVLDASVAAIGFQKLVLNKDKNTVFLPEEGMKIGFGAIGKGYAADRVKALLQAAGLKAGLINASGDIAAWGTQPDGQPWQIGLINPMKKDKVFAWFPINGQAVVTSGDYEKYVTIEGERYGHIINPRTGLPSKGVVSATVFAPKAELADALATALFVMGPESGLHLANQLPDVEALMIDASGHILSTKNIVVDALE